jgi:Holliday junction DNA helicase RuvA
MIAALEGTVTSIHETHCILMVHGVGYKIHTPGRTLTSLTKGSETFLHTYLAVREDALELFGFEHEDERTLFELLIGISGVGPRSALGIIGLDSVSALTSAIASGNIGYLTKVSGIGKKSAEKIVLELREKVGGLTTESNETLATQGDEDVLEALVAMGYTVQTAREAVHAIPEDITDQSERIKYALRQGLHR